MIGPAAAWRSWRIWRWQGSRVTGWQGRKAAGLQSYKGVDMEKLLALLAAEGGCIVSSADCHEIEIAEARARGDFWVDDDGLGYVRRLPEWLSRHSRYARGATDPCEAAIMPDPSVYEIDLTKKYIIRIKDPLSPPAVERITRELKEWMSGDKTFAILEGDIKLVRVEVDNE